MFCRNIHFSVIGDHPSSPMFCMTAKSCIMTAGIMHSTCAQLGIQSDPWFAHQIWFVDNSCDATHLFAATLWLQTGNKLLCSVAACFPCIHAADTDVKVSHHKWRLNYCEELKCPSHHIVCEQWGQTQPVQQLRAKVDQPQLTVRASIQCDKFICAMRPSLEQSVCQSKLSCQCFLKINHIKFFLLLLHWDNIHNRTRQHRKSVSLLFTYLCLWCDKHWHGLLTELCLTLWQQASVLIRVHMWVHETLLLFYGRNWNSLLRINAALYNQ